MAAAATAASLSDVAPAVKALLNSHFPSGPAARRDLPAFLATLRAEEAHLHRQARACSALATFTFLHFAKAWLREAFSILARSSTVPGDRMTRPTQLPRESQAPVYLLAMDVAAKEALARQAVKTTEDFQTGLQALLALCTRLDALKGQAAVVTQTAKPVLKELEEVATEVMALGRVQDYVECLLHLEQVNAGLEASVAGLDSADVRRSVWEEWSKAVAGLAAAHLRNTALPLLAKMLDVDENSIAAAAGPSPAATWLHTVDYTLRFDRSMAAFGDFTARETSAKVQEGANPRWDGNALDVFAERKEWLQIRTRLELEDALQKLIKVLKDEESWQLADTLLGVEELAKEAGRSAVEFKPPVGAHCLVLLMRVTTSRCATLSSREKRLAFVRDSVAPLADRYLQELLVQSQEAEGLTALATDSGLYKVAQCLNAARYVANYLQEWSEEVPMAELLHSFADDGQEGDATSEADEKSVFQQELADLMSFADEWTGKIVSAIIRAFGARCTEYVQDKKRWRDDNTAQFLQRSAEGPLLPSQRLLEAVLELEGKLDALSRVMDEFVFVDTWRRIAAGLDQYLIINWSLKFTAKPASFFRNLRDTCTLLRLPTEEASAALLMIASAEDLPQRSSPSDALLTEVGQNVVRMLKEHGVTRMLPSMVGDILKRRLDLSKRLSVITNQIHLIDSEYKRAIDRDIERLISIASY
eukprot:SM000011S19116  [mRNA]  locus=s11:912281:917936:- [translate_table: standard]